jgi:hypothetical protein
LWTGPSPLEQALYCKKQIIFSFDASVDEHRRKYLTSQYTKGRLGGFTRMRPKGAGNRVAGAGDDEDARSPE